MLGIAADPEFAPWLHTLTLSTQVCAAVLRVGDSLTLVDMFSAADGAIERPRDDLFPYHAWYGEQASINFWEAAFSWTLFWRTVFLGESGDPCWMDNIMTPVPTTPLLGFLDISGGRVTWGFQLEMLYRLADDNLTRAVQFRKHWNARNNDAIEASVSLMLPNGASLLDTIEAHAPYGASRGDSTVPAVPVHAACLMLKA